MPVPQEVRPMPKKSCLLTVMFPIDDDQEAIDVKKVVNEALLPYTDKRITMQINES
jgi:hypothetical protein